MLKQDIDYLSYSLTDIFNGDDDEFTETFHEFTKLTPSSVIEISKRVNQITSDIGLMSMMSRSWKKYAGCEKVRLDKDAPLGEMTLSDAIRRRCSLSSYATEFAPDSMTIAQLGAILQYSFGATRHMPAKNKNAEGVYLRAATSAGGLYPLEIYPIVFNVDGLERGLYHYYMPEHALHRLRTGDLMEEVLRTTTYVDLVKNASVMFVITGVWARTIVKYRQRGYRFLLNDAGALLQNLYLTGTSFDLGTCALGGFYDDKLARLLGVNPRDEPVIIGFLLGSKPRPPQQA
jgi:SagB-type dehydrogenase family enzyme